MTVGLPGAGVGGVFYLLSALAMPLHACGCWLLEKAGLRAARESGPRWGLIAQQFATAVGIIAGLWLTGWALAALLVAHPTALGQMHMSRVGERIPNVLRVGAVIVSLGTLAGVLLTVQIARLVVRADDARDEAANAESPEASAAKRLLRAAAAILFMVFTPSAAAQTTDSLAPQADTVKRDSAVAAVVDPAVARFAVADSAFKSGNTALARREYEAIIAADPFASRALYRLGQLNAAQPRTAQEFFRRYVAAEPADAWGWIALGDSYAEAGNIDRALASYDSAARIAPKERDVAIGRARILNKAGRIDAAIVAYEAWTPTATGDAEAWRELGDARRRAGRYREAARAYATALEVEDIGRNRSRMNLARGLAAPTAEVHVDGSRDSDENQTSRARAAVGANVGDRMRAVISGSRRWITGAADFGEPDFTVDEAKLGLFARPLASLRFEAEGGVAIPRAEAVGANEKSVFVGSARGTWKQPGGRGSVDLRATRILLDATPLLVQNHVTRSEIAGRADLPVLSRVSIRAGARAASYASPLQDNTRLSMLGGLAVAATNAIEVSGVFQRLTFSDAAEVGYFAPRVAQLAEAGTYAEFETAGGSVLALDAGAGAQRFTEFGSTTTGKWEPAFRAFASFTAPLRPGSELRLEIDTYDSRLAGDAVTTANWRFFSASAGVRLAFN